MKSKCIGEIIFSDSEEGSSVSVNGKFRKYPYQQWAKTILRELSKDPEFRSNRKYLSYAILFQILEIWDTISPDNPDTIDPAKEPTILIDFIDRIPQFLDSINLKYYNQSIVVDTVFIESVIRGFNKMLLDHMSVNTSLKVYHHSG